MILKDVQNKEYISTATIEANILYSLKPNTKPARLAFSQMLRFLGDLSVLPSIQLYSSMPLEKFLIFLLRNEKQTRDAATAAHCTSGVPSTNFAASRRSSWHANCSHPFAVHIETDTQPREFNGDDNEGRVRQQQQPQVHFIIILRNTHGFRWSAPGSGGGLLFFTYSLLFLRPSCLVALIAAHLDTL